MVGHADELERSFQQLNKYLHEARRSDCMVVVYYIALFHVQEIAPDAFRAAVCLAAQRYELYIEDAKQATKVCPKPKKPKAKKDTADKEFRVWGLGF